MSETRAGPFMIDSAERMQQLGSEAADGLRPGQVIFLIGELGAGKTTWVRGVLKGLGHDGPVKSPTYTLLEPYNLRQFNVYHFDLYRLSNPMELENLGFRDYLDGSGVCLFEWPDRGAGLLPGPDCRIEIEYRNGGRLVDAFCSTELGKALCVKMH